MTRSLTVSLVAIGLAQLAVLTVIAVLIAWLTMPPPPGRPHGPPPPTRGHHEDERAHERPPPPALRHEPPASRGEPLLGPLLTLLAGVIVIGVGGGLTARWIVVPLRTLAHTARAAGAGDLTARARLERDDELGDVARALDEMVERVESQIITERELLANVSHELRTPMARIRVATELAAEGDPEAVRAALEDITQDLEELESIVGDILVAARLDAHARAGATPLRPGAMRETAASEIGESAAARYRRRCPDSPLSVEVEDDALVLVDPALFRRVLDNLLENARKYSPEGSPISLVVSHTPTHVRFLVADQGMGISKGDLAQVFDPFFRAERSRARGAGGVGLGLTLVKRITEAHGGSVRVESDLGEGTKVRVELRRVVV
ncbi:MAG: HAMP domain-containing sensor histidine kinase [Sandaracinaceae bacterium]